MNKRPGLDPFLEALAREYNTIVFTAAMPDYAGPVLDYIDPKGTLFHRRLYRSSCRQVPKRPSRFFSSFASHKGNKRSFFRRPLVFTTHYIFRLGNCSVKGYGSEGGRKGYRKSSGGSRGCGVPAFTGAFLLLACPAPPLARGEKW